MKDVLIIQVNAMLPADVMEQIHKNVVAMMDDKVVILPAYIRAELISVPEDIEVRIEMGEDSNEL